ncbi:recombinase family protein [Stenotrophomonas maltophilia]|uniref:recombinase family protein n=1 Tax=Stenotrophomonas maltophilia TaxID=40324 RepID=UPI00130E22E1|nr:recombinase family protein [Stenotrophomonas maltophilia]
MTLAYTYIRFSTPEQGDGHSLERQQSAIDAFVRENNLTLTESSAFQDLGVSSYRGANLRNGLGKFIAEVDAGRVPKGSYLLVESLDRLSRQRVMDALTLLVSLIDKGIRVVPLNDDGAQVLDKGAGLTSLVMALSVMHRANEESETKSRRVKAAWQAKRRNAANKPVSRRAPEWLEFDEATSSFKPIQERVDVVRKIYELADAGLGRGRIVKYLNSNGFSSFRNPSEGWQTSSVSKILRNRSLIGFYQPHCMYYDTATGVKKRVPDGDEVPDYYPKVIEEDLFLRVNARQYAPIAPLVGRQGVTLTNLFTGFVYCHWCGAAMSMANKGPGRKGGRYLVCSKGRRGKDCKYRSWNYDDVEMYVLYALRQLDLAAVLAGVDTNQRRQHIRTELARTSLELAESERRLASLSSELVSQAPANVRTLVGVIATLEAAVDEQRRRCDELQAEDAALGAPVEDPRTFAQNLLRLYDEMASAQTQQLYLLRVRLRQHISRLLSRIDVMAVGKGEPTVTKDGNNSPKLFLTFKDGRRRMVLPIGRNSAHIADLPPLPTPTR